jgi:hypothetical protein
MRKISVNSESPYRISEEGSVRRQDEEKVALQGARKDGGLKVKPDKAKGLGTDKRWPRQQAEPE